MQLAQAHGVSVTHQPPQGATATAASRSERYNAHMHGAITPPHAARQGVKECFAPHDIVALFEALVRNSYMEFANKVSLSINSAA